jgi:hypothetical protein
LRRHASVESSQARSGGDDQIVLDSRSKQRNRGLRSLCLLGSRDGGSYLACIQTLADTPEGLARRIEKMALNAHSSADGVPKNIN